MKICKKCGCSFEINNCPACKKFYDANNKIKNIERRRASHIIRYAANKEHLKSVSTAWRKENPERDKANRLSRKDKETIANKIRHQENKERYNTAASAWYYANKDIAAALNKEWHKNNPDAKRIYSQNRRALKKDNGGKLSKGLAEKLFKLQKGKCACCGKHLGDDYHLDHIMPLYLGGANEDWNIQLLLSKCNHKKRSKHPIDFMQSKGFLL